ncbi:MAG TPA: hypothetical protein VFW94_09905 [Candidatus Acidoferrales bacterium]|nr:hypothetical protein [Candidatus Acidoferrales bacterium]
MIHAIDILYYVTRSGKDAFDDWLSELADPRTQAKIAARINRLAAGNFGDCKALGQGLYVIGQARVLLLCRGDKRTQSADILKAHEYLTDYKARTEKK